MVGPANNASISCAGKSRLHELSPRSKLLLIGPTPNACRPKTSVPLLLEMGRVRRGFCTVNRAFTVRHSVKPAMVALPLNPICFAEGDASPGYQIPPRRRPPTVEGDSGVRGGLPDLPPREGAALPGLMAGRTGARRARGRQETNENCDGLLRCLISLFCLRLVEPIAVPNSAHRANTAPWPSLVIDLYP